MSNPISSSSCRRRSGFTLVELIVVMGVLAVLAALALPAIQKARESARASHCANNLKNIGVGLANFHGVHRAFPAGNEFLKKTEHAWSSRILPFLEHDALAARIDYKLVWDAAGPNQLAASETLPIYVCPSSVTAFAGKQDYGGVMGTSLLPLSAGMGPTDAFGCGVLIYVNQQQPRPVRAAMITDGLSRTLIVGESVDRDDEAASRWACGRNCFAQNEKAINMNREGSLHSLHPAGPHGLFADGHVTLLGDTIAAMVLGAICTRQGGELLDGSGL